MVETSRPTRIILTGQRHEDNPESLGVRPYRNAPRPKYGQGQAKSVTGSVPAKDKRLQWQQQRSDPETGGMNNTNRINHMQE